MRAQLLAGPGMRPAQPLPEDSQALTAVWRQTQEGQVSRGPYVPWTCPQSPCSCPQHSSRGPLSSLPTCAGLEGRPSPLSQHPGSFPFSGSVTSSCCSPRAHQLGTGSLAERLAVPRRRQLPAAQPGLSPPAAPASHAGGCSELCRASAAAARSPASRQRRKQEQDLPCQAPQPLLQIHQFLATRMVFSR